MRFRASIENVSTFFRLIQAVEKLQKKCIIKLTDATIHIICNNDANEGGVQVWSLIKVPSLFSNYRIQSNSNNEITLQVSSEHLLSALRSSSLSSSNSSYETEEIVMKLAKKNDHPVLSFEIHGKTMQGRRVHVGHDVQIDVMKPSEVEKLREPLCPDPDVNIMFPSLLKLRTMVERLRLMSDFLAIQANNNGCLKFSIQTETVSVVTEWKNRKHPSSFQNNEEESSESKDKDELFTVVVSIKSFLRFLNSHVVEEQTVACVCHGHCMIFYVYINDHFNKENAGSGGVLTFYIPAIIDDE